MKYSVWLAGTRTNRDDDYRLIKMQLDFAAHETDVSTKSESRPSPRPKNEDFRLSLEVVDFR
jgi:hypothetical protein